MESSNSNFNIDDVVRAHLLRQETSRSCPPVEKVKDVNPSLVSSQDVPVQLHLENEDAVENEVEKSESPIIIPSRKTKNINPQQDQIDKVLEQIEKQAEYVFDPEKWAYDHCGFKADVWQAEAFADFARHGFIAISTGTGTGKTAFLSILVLFFLSTRPFPKVPCTAPSQDQLHGALWAEIAKWRRKSEFLMKTFEWTKTTVKHKAFPENWMAIARTARLQSNKKTVETLQGLHEKHILMVVDEASGVPDQVMNAVDGAITTPGACVVLTSNPTRRTGYFYRTITDKLMWIENGGDFAVKFVSCENAKHCDPKHISRAIRIYGKESDFYRVKVLGLPPRTDSQVLISPEQIYAAHERGRRLEEEGVSEESLVDSSKDGVSQLTNVVVISCDPARYGDDSTVFLVRTGQKLTRREVLHHKKTTEVAQIGWKLIKEHNADHMCVDTIGIGAGVADRLDEYLEDHNRKAKQEKALNLVFDTVVHHVEVGKNPEAENTKDKNGNFYNKEDATKAARDKYFNLRSQLFWLAKTHIDLALFCIVTPELDEELSSIGYGWDQRDKKIKIESKDTIKKVLKRSPNDADAFALLYFPDLLAFHKGMNYTAGAFALGELESGPKSADVGSQPSSGMPTGLVTNPNLDIDESDYTDFTDLGGHRFSGDDPNKSGSVFGGGLGGGSVGGRRYSRLRSRRW